MRLDIKSIIDSVSVQQDITLVTVYKLPNETSAVAGLFSYLGDEDINIDMIALNPSVSAFQTVSFSVQDKDMSKVINTVGRIKSDFSDVRTDINANNLIITFSGSAIKDECGVCAYIFASFARYNTEIKLITTSETTIACLVDDADYSKVKSMLEEVFNIKNV